MSPKRTSCRVASRRGSIYVATLGVSMLVTTIAVAGLSVARLERRAMETSGSSVEAMNAIRSGVEIGIEHLNATPNWRVKSSLLHSGDLFGVQTDVVAVDAYDSSLTDGACDSVLVVVSGSVGASLERFALRIDPRITETMSETIDAMRPVSYWPLRNLTTSFASNVRESTFYGQIIGDVLTNGGACEWCYDAPTFSGGGYIEIAHRGLYELDEGSVSMWFYANQLGGVQGLLSKDDAVRGDGELMLALNEDQLWLEFASGKGGSAMKVTGVAKGTWHHVVVSFGSAGLALYLDGQLAGEEPSMTTGLGTIGNTDVSQNPLLLAVLSSGSTPGTLDVLEHPFYGKLRDVALFAYNLTDQQIKQIASEPPVPLEFAPLGTERYRVIDGK